jgi:hypothetical protein
VSFVKKSTKLILGGVGALIVVLIVLFSTIWVQATHGLWSLFRVGAMSWLLLLAAIVLALTAVTRVAIRDERREKLREERYTARNSRYYSNSAFSDEGKGNSNKEITEKPTRHVLLFSLAGSAFALMFLIIPVQSFLNTYGTYSSTQVEKTNDAALLSFTERVPFDVADAVSDRSLGDTLGNSTGTVKAIPMSNEYTTSVIRRGMFQGYESVQTMKLPLYGAANTNNDVTFCKYSESAQLRLGGMGLNNNMEMRIYQQTSPSTLLNSSDAIAICAAKDEPVLYIPLTKLDGGLFPHRVPAGVAVYNGKTGELKIEKDLTNAPVPVYPMSLAAEQREALAAGQGFGDWLFHRAGFETTSKDKDDPNAGNNTEFAMKAANDEKKGLYVTPLTPRGSSSSIVGLSTIDSNSVADGKLNALAIHRYEDNKTRDANSTVSATIVSTVLEGYKANGLTVFEVVPAKDGTWTASIGKNQSILYRANIAADGHTVKLTDASGSETKGDLGSQPADSAPGDGKTPAPSTNKPVSEMSPDELKALADSITAELAKRASSKG